MVDHSGPIQRNNHSYGFSLKECREFFPSLSSPLQCNYIWVKSIFAADGYTLSTYTARNPKKEFAEKAGIIKGVTVIENWI